MEMEERGERILVNDRIISLRSKLRKAIELNKMNLFCETIDGSDVSSYCLALESYDSDNQMSPFEIACGTANRAPFIRECISIGCDANRQNPKCGRRPISFAIQQFHHDNLEALLSDTSVSLEFKHSNQFPFAPINYLLELISDKLYEFKENCLCIGLLVKHCADMNVPGKDGKTPIRNILERKNLNYDRKRKLLQCIFDYAKFIDIDDTLLFQLNELIPNLKLPPVGIQQDRKLTVDHIERCLKNNDGNEIEFWQYFRIEKDNSSECDWHSALDYAVRRGLLYSVERIFRSGVIKTMFSLDECKEPLLTCAIRRIGWNDNANIEKCVDLFLANRKIDINAKDKFGYTSLFSSIKSNKSNVTAKLLERGAYVGIESKWNDMAISDIKPQLLEKHFDGCITGDDRNINNEFLELTFDYKNLIPLHSKVNFPEFAEMKSIECILETSALRHLIKHPLVDSFLDLKWNKLAFVFYTNFFFCALFTVLNIFYIFVFFLDDVDLTPWMKVCQMLLLCLMITRETIQMVFSPCIYFKRHQNYLECMLIGLIAFILFGSCAMLWRGAVAAVAILLIAYELTISIGSLPIRSFAMHYVMLETVATNFFKSLLYYSTIIAAFALAFCSLFHKLSPETNNETTSSNRTGDDEQKVEEYHNFQSFGLSMLKAIVMANGELETSSIKFNNNVMSYIVFVAFILLVTTVLGNLLGGLAVSDINEIRTQAQWTHLIRRCEVLARYEKTFREESRWLIWFPKLKHFILSKVCLYPNFRSKYQMKFNPNKRRTRNIGEMTANWFRHMKGLLTDRDIMMKEALKRLNQNVDDESDDIAMLRNEISKIADSNDSIQHQIDAIGKTMNSIEKMLVLRNNKITK